MLRLVRAVDIYTDVISLSLSEFGEFDAEFVEVQASHFLVQILGQTVNTNLILLLPKVELRKCLICKRIAHHKRRMTRSAAKVYEATFGKNYHRMTVREHVLIHLRLDVVFLDAGPFFEVSHHYLVVKMTDVADDRLVLHLRHLLCGDDVAVAGAGNVDVAVWERVIHSGYLKTFHSSLQCANRVDFRNQNPCAKAPHTPCAALANVAVSANNHNLAGNHNVGGALDAVRQRFAAAVEVVEFGFCNGVVYVDGGEQQLALFSHLVEPVDARSGLLRKTK